MSLNEEQRCDLVDLYWEKAMLTKTEYTFKKTSLQCSRE